MSGAISVGAAVVATALAVDTVATVGLTVGAAFAIAGAVGATAAAVGTIAKIPELKYAGMALGAVGGIGSIASAAGVFGSEAAQGTLFGLNAAESGTGAAQAANAASEGWAGVGSEVAQFVSPVAPFTNESLAATNAAAGFGDAGMGAFGAIPDATAWGTGADVVDMVNGTGAVTPPTGVQPVPTGVETVPTGTAPGVLTNQQLPQFDNVVPEFTISRQPSPKLPAFDNVVPDGSLPGQSPLLSQQPTTVDIGQGQSAGGTLGTVENVQRPVGANEGLLTQQQPTGQVSLNQPTTPPTTQSVTPQSNPPFQGIGGNTAVPQIGGGTMNMAEKSVFDNILSFIGKNPTLAFGALQAGGSFLSGAFGGGLKPEQAEALKAQAEQNRATAALAEQQQHILEMRQQNLSRVPMAVRTPLLRQGGGISPGPLNSPVTGVPA